MLVSHLRKLLHSTIVSTNVSTCLRQIILEKNNHFIRYRLISEFRQKSRKRNPCATVTTVSGSEHAVSSLSSFGNVRTENLSRKNVFRFIPTHSKRQVRYVRTLSTMSTSYPLYPAIATRMCHVLGLNNPESCFPKRSLDL